MLRRRALASNQQQRARLTRLKLERRKLSKRMARLEAEIARLSPSRVPRRRPSPQEVDEWIEELAAGMPALRSLPSDWSRADLYNDHD